MKVTQVALTFCFSDNNRQYPVPTPKSQLAVILTREFRDSPTSGAGDIDARDSAGSRATRRARGPNSHGRQLEYQQKTARVIPVVELRRRQPVYQPP